MDIIHQDVPKKQCKGICGQFLPATPEFFHVHRTTGDKLRKECKKCRSEERKAYHIANKARDNAQSKAWEDKHKDWRKEYQEEHKEHIQRYQHEYSATNREHKRKYRETHREQLRAIERQYHRDHREHYREQERIYYQSVRGREVSRAKEHRRRAREMALPGELTAEQIQLKLRLQRFRCYYADCGYAKFKKRNGKYDYHIEHTIPVSRAEMQPRHDMSYVVLSCSHCNLIKQNKIPSEFFRGGRLM